MGCICSICKSVYYKITDCYYKIEQVNETELTNNITSCSYPYCYTIRSILVTNNKYIRNFKIINSHKNMNFNTGDYEETRYVDL